MSTEELDQLMASHGWFYYCKEIPGYPPTRVYRTSSDPFTDRRALCNLLSLDDTLRVHKPHLAKEPFIQIYHQ